MRGIAMAEVAEMDVLMEETLAHAFRHADSGAVEEAKTRTIEKLRERMEGEFDSASGASGRRWSFGCGERRSFVYLRTQVSGHKKQWPK